MHTPSGKRVPPKIVESAKALTTAIRARMRRHLTPKEVGAAWVRVPPYPAEAFLYLHEFGDPTRSGKFEPAMMAAFHLATECLIDEREIDPLCWQVLAIFQYLDGMVVTPAPAPGWVGPKL